MDNYAALFWFSAFFMPLLGLAYEIYMFVFSHRIGDSGIASYLASVKSGWLLWAAHILSGNDDALPRFRSV